MLRAVATWWDGVELWLTQLDFALQVAIVVGILGPLAWGIAALVDSAVERIVAHRLAAYERRRATARSGSS